MDSVGIVGGGRAGLRLLELFRSSEDTPVAFVADGRVDAPAVLAAKMAGVPTVTDARAAIRSKAPRFVFEVTGSDEVAAALRETCAEAAVELVTHQAAAIVLTSIDRSDQALSRRLVAEVSAIRDQMNRSLSDMHRLLAEIDDITSGMQMLALNARIEAARVGEQGRGFAVVAAEVAASADAIRKTATELGTLNGDIQSVASGIETTLKDVVTQRGTASAAAPARR